MNLQEFKPILEQQMKTALTQKEFCERYAIAYSTFTYWKKKALESSADNPFIELNNCNVTDKLSSTQSPFEIVTPSGYVVKVPSSLFDLNAIINTLR
jgi:hypothetical protein